MTLQNAVISRMAIGMVISANKDESETLELFHQQKKEKSIVQNKGPISLACLSTCIPMYPQGRMWVPCDFQIANAAPLTPCRRRIMDTTGSTNKSGVGHGGYSCGGIREGLAAVQMYRCETSHQGFSALFV